MVTLPKKLPTRRQKALQQNLVGDLNPPLPNLHTTDGQPRLPAPPDDPCPSLPSLQQQSSQQQQPPPLPQQQQDENPLNEAVLGSSRGQKLLGRHLCEDGILASLFNQMKGVDPEEAQEMEEAEDDVEEGASDLLKDLRATEKKVGYSIKEELLVFTEEFKQYGHTSDSRRFHKDVLPMLENSLSTFLIEQMGLAKNETNNNIQIRIPKDISDTYFMSDDRVLDDDDYDDNESDKKPAAVEKLARMEEETNSEESLPKLTSQGTESSTENQSDKNEDEASQGSKSSTENHEKSNKDDQVAALPILATNPSQQSVHPSAAPLPPLTKASLKRGSDQEPPAKKAKTSSKKQQVELIRQFWKGFHQCLTSTTVAKALFPKESMKFQTLAPDNDGPMKRKMKSAWEDCIDSISAKFLARYGLSVDFNRSPHFYPDNYQFTEKELIAKQELQGTSKKQSSKKKVARQWTQQSFAPNRKVFWHCNCCKDNNKLFVVAVGKCIVKEECKYGVTVDQVFYHDAGCCSATGTSSHRTTHHTTFDYDHDAIFMGIFDKTITDLHQFTAKNPLAIPDGAAIATSSKICYDDRTFLELPFNDEYVPCDSFWRNSINTESVDFKELVIRLGYCLSSKMNLSNDLAPYLLDLDVLRKTSNRPTQDMENPAWHLYIWNLALLFGGMSTTLTMFDKKVIHQYCHTDSDADLDLLLEDADHPLSQHNPSTAKAIPASFELALEDLRQIYINHPDSKILRAERKKFGASVGLYFDNLCWHGGLTETKEAVGAVNGQNRKWRLALHGHVDSIHYDRNPEALGLPTLGQDGGLYVLPEHSAVRNTQAQAVKDLVYYAKNFATMVDLLKKNGREKVLGKIPVRAIRILEEEYAGMVGTGSARK